MPRRQHRPGWLWSRLTSGSKGQIAGEVAAGPGPDTPVSSADRPPGGIWRPRASSHLVLSGLFAAQLAGIFAVRIPRHGFGIGLALLTAGLLFGLQLWVGWRGAARWPRRRRLGTLVAMGALTYLPLAALGVVWPGMAGFFAGSILILRPARTSWVPFALVVASMLVAPLQRGIDARDATYLMTASLSSGLMVFAIYQLRLVAKRAQGETAQLAQLTSVRERERFSMDLHDILGYSLSAITLKAELTKKLLQQHLAGARGRIGRLLAIRGVHHTPGRDRLWSAGR
jgi:two-component system sensor histidine kinase DesK